MPAINENLQKEIPRKSKAFRDWKGVFTQAARNAIPEDNWYQCENLQPIGHANAHSINDISASLVNYGANTIYWSVYACIGAVDYLINFATNGNVYAYNIGSGANVLINSGTPLSGTGSRATQWNNTQVLFIDSTGYYHWDGTTFAAITGTGVPTSGTEIVVYAGRVWIFEGRLLVVSAAADYTAAAFLAANGATFVNLTDPQLRTTVYRAISANGYLYFVGKSSVNVISNVYVPTGASPPAPLFTNTNIQSTLGSDQPGSFFTIDDRDLYFANYYGVYIIRGVTADRISMDIDGTWQYRDTGVQSSGGPVVTNNIMHAAVLMKRLNDPIYGSNTILCMYADQKWWFANYGALTLISSAMNGAQVCLFGFIGNQLYQLFASTTSSPTFTVSTALWAMDDPLADKFAIYAGFEATIQNLISSFTATIDTPNSSYPFVLSGSVGQVQWVNNSSSVVTWINNALAPVTWYNGSFLLNWGLAPAGAGKYIGITITGRAQMELSGIYMDYKLGARWGGGTQ